ncbi:signal peptidase I [Sporosarcina sp. Te-1]|uniref:signal peptidase I n=1 Tax=Sporosarcina sp. Te-1 TaxID=2818390 RepID=UPI001A9EA7E1|nr:signal peptidase I [Sporosarcina sp. Te-1]QTD39713.1 signal peptidase I [Sporosarcina sp. Te-1]
MKHLSDDEILQELKQLGKAFEPNPEQRKNVQRLLFQPSRPQRTFRQRTLLPTIISLIVLCSICVGLYINFSGSSAKLGGSSTVDVTSSWEGILLKQTSHTSPTKYVILFTKNSFTIEDQSIIPFIQQSKANKEEAIRGYKIKDPTLVPGEYTNYTVKKSGDTYTITASDSFTYTLEKFGPRRYVGEDGIEYSTRSYLDQEGTITDEVTPRRLESAEQTEQTFLIDWSSDAMDSGDHDFDTSYHGQLVVSPDTKNLERGQAVYYHMPRSIITKNPAIPEMYIGRIIGLPGERVEIKSGQVYIDGMKLDSFYGKATVRGMGEIEYFTNKDSEQGFKEYFNMNMSPVKVQDDMVFLLVDQWWRGTDSRDFGSLPIQEIEGVIIGYEE